jgi:hypothetical protein
MRVFLFQIRILTSLLQLPVEVAAGLIPPLPRAHSDAGHSEKIHSLSIERQQPKSFLQWIAEYLKSMEFFLALRTPGILMSDECRKLLPISRLAQMALNPIVTGRVPQSALQATQPPQTSVSYSSSLNLKRFNAP